MRPSSALILLAVLAAPPALAADPAAVDPSAFTIGVDQVNLSRSISFNDGDLARGLSSDQMSVQLRLTYGGVPVVDIGALRCDSALTDTGEELAQGTPQDTGTARMMMKQYRRFSSMSGMKPYAPLTLNLRYPAKPAKSLARLKASLEVVCETAPGEIIDLAPAGDWVGRKREIPGSDEGFTILALAPLKYVCDKAVSEEKSITALAFLDDHGKEIQSGGWSGSGDGKRTTVTRNGLDLPAQGSIRITLVGRTATVKIPVDLADIPLQAPPRPVVAAPVPVAPVAPAAPPVTGKPSKSTDF